MTSILSGAEGTRRAKLISFIRADHRYVLLGTSAIAALGMALSSQPRPALSFLAGAYTLEVAMYYLLVAWVALSAVALVFKLAAWKTYARVSPFTRPAVAHALRYGSYVVCAITALLAVDRIGCGLASAWEVATTAQSRPTSMLESMLFMLYNSRAIFFSGFKTTVALAVFGTVIAFFLALLLVFLRMQVIDRSDNDFVRFWKVVGSGFARVYSTVVRGTPMMVQAMIIFFGVFGLFKMTNLTTTQINAIWSTFTAGLVTIVLNSTAYMMEVLRGGIESVDAGQTEAARSLGLSQWEAMRTVVFPQGVKFAIPGLSNELVINIKDSSVLSVIGTFDLMFATTTVGGIYYAKFEAALVTSVIYLCLTMFASWLLGRFANRLNVKSVKLGSTSNQPVNVEER
ncbi:amino acid ABC transporter permease [Collinsella stercoris]|uniref:ABC transporter, permease protein n=1 Tax=Collinsella stercoris DSM 13279 TaxID=445975 RepID=B6G9K0_9ACTN|nr:amino acid ABC transporter permease [Collinsella stercoris]EEA91051.1 ABC transporter, permease protein [Collinsella stercoris DSM 13279]UEA46412.1 amino acid ABC transporter permease [Collinsella stercoris DSM 13279]UWP11069.1 amino acid ABC transporter permease [Collinsella stercoris]